ncbi:hypothetical protein ASPACDRAFT_110101 [Aspergillus aculeatus ATCC 16872]|uniref:Uncharacterized protein n=1 Tax=Aspergillus aculeatus (strain ATCC 16872 / CBS 172.66 / WB 5094) TaxID=690307 RepID=A0A1L9X9H9_ASPA1|nr:uncharacterized protein ASPACDRAFT_110101 [Aspergillus aculeatus ATCC 16872]OJK05014.1 hypothetical protein ASPACDRAFT_110101 [Aspergillus aculeatus ATCC 16872]
MPASFLELLEKLLEGTGNRKAAQKLRRWQHGRQSCNVNTLVLEYIEAETKLRFNIQREASVQMEHEALFISSTCSIDNDKKTTASTVSRMEALQNELRSLSEGIWHQERKMDMVHARLCSLPIRRALVSCHKDKEWYLSEWMRRDCARREGCCARECGCCRRPRSARRPQHRGHCTAVRACCEQSRGFAVTGKDVWEPGKMAGASKEHQLNLYATRLRDAYFFGL